jgi:very-short-patch-repair endonuclease
VQQQTRTPEKIIAGLAASSHGVVTRAQLLRAGLSPEEVRQRELRGSLLREHRGVFRVGHRAPSVEARYLAAVLACGDGALLSGRAAAHHLRLLGGAAPPPEVTARNERRVKGIRTRRSRRLDARDTTVWRGIPVTTVARTLVDLADVLPIDDLARACHEAGVKHQTTPAEVEAALRRTRGRRGASDLRRVLRGDAPVALSKLEARFLERLRVSGLELPETNRVVSGRRVDCHWPRHRLTIELDGYRYHRSRHAWEKDRHREREARARGDEFRRFTYGDVFERPGLMLAELRQLIARA